MSTCNFTMAHEGKADKLLLKARQAVESQGGQFTGDGQSGNFSLSLFGNSVAGKYQVNGPTLDINITDKPFMVPCSVIESYLKSQISK